MTNATTSASSVSDPNASATGPAWAALLSASIGSAAFGLLTDASECSARAVKALNWYNPSGSLSGVAICAIAIWLAIWALLHVTWKGKNTANQGKLMAALIFLVLAALVTTFPPFYELFVKGG